MLRGVYAAATGMINQRERLDVISNNLANISTTAFKRSQPVSRGFYQIFAEEVGRFPSLRGSREVPGGGAALDATAKDFSPGPIVDTGNPLDLAIDGPGFFVVRTPAGERYTRAGSFSLNPEGLLVTPDGEPVLGEQGPIVIQGESVAISPDGSVIIDGEPSEQIRVVDFPQPHRLTRYGRNQFGADEETAATREPVATPSLRVSALEHANVNPIAELVAMMDASRSYEAHQRVIIAMNESLDAAVNEIART
jgi:flagellar basal-body rod protein FlgG